MRSFIACVVGSLMMLFPAYAEEVLVDVASPRGVSQKFLLIKPDTPVAAVVLFAGGKGTLKLSKGLFGGVSITWGKKNFLVRTRDKFAAHDLMVALVDAPSDYLDKKGMLGGFRSSDDHVEDIDAVIAKLREIADVPVWLVGTSRGTESVATIAIASQQKPEGLVLTSSMTASDTKGDSVLDKALSEIRIPTLITHHEEDGCAKTRPEGVALIRDGLINAPVVELKMFSGGAEQSNPCKGMSKHGYLGIEDLVVDAIVAFIKAN